MGKTSVRAWITDHALTAGIVEVAAEHDPAHPNMISWRDAKGYLRHAHGNGWHLNRETAVSRAREMRDAKIASHERSITKLRKLVFTP